MRQNLLIVSALGIAVQGLLFVCSSRFVALAKRAIGSVVPGEPFPRLTELAFQGGAWGFLLIGLVFLLLVALLRKHPSGSLALSALFGADLLLLLLVSWGLLLPFAYI